MQTQIGSSTVCGRPEICCITAGCNGGTITNLAYGRAPNLSKCADKGLFTYYVSQRGGGAGESANFSFSLTRGRGGDGPFLTFLTKSAKNMKNWQKKSYLSLNMIHFNPNCCLHCSFSYFTQV